jgi:uncharacterized protein
VSSGPQGFLNYATKERMKKHRGDHFAGTSEMDGAVCKRRCVFCIALVGGTNSIPRHFAEPHPTFIHFLISGGIFVCDMKLSQAKIDQIKEYFRDKPVKKAYLFGSYAKGTATSHSDLDILVELDYNHRMGLEFIQMKLDLESLLKKDVDLVTTKGISLRVQPMVEKTKQLIYAR